jgi:hypothetical protein
MLKLLFAVTLYLLGNLVAQAATISIVSMQYSAAHPVPHIHYEGGTEASDLESLQQVYDTFVRCRLECIGQRGGSTAVLTLSGPGGNYHTGLLIAEFLRENHIATVAERGAVCLSACAFAFLGGSGYSPLVSVGTYIDRMVEPGSRVGFHAPYMGEEDFFAGLEATGPMGSQGVSRNSLALMVQQLVRWNVDPLVLYDMMSMGPSDTYDLVRPEDLYLTRTALPPSPTRTWIADWPEALRNACMRLLAVYEHSHPFETWDRLYETSYQVGIGSTQASALSGFRLSESLLDVGHCSATETSLATGGDVDLALYFNPMFGQPHSNEVISFFNRNDGWSSAGIGGLPIKRIYQRGPMNHFFLPLGVNIDDLDLPGELEVMENRFFSVAGAALPPLATEMQLVSFKGSRRVSRNGDVWLFEQLGNARLFNSALDETYNFGFSNERVSSDSFVREGAYPDGTAFAWVGFLDGNSSNVIHAMVLKPAGVTATTEEWALVRRLECAARFGGFEMHCG